MNKSAYREDYAYANTQNDNKTYFPKTLSADKGVILETDDVKIEMTPVSGKEFVVSDICIIQ